MHSILISTSSPAVQFQYILCRSLYSITNDWYHRWSLDRLYQYDQSGHRNMLS